jgi:phosphatidylinositol 4-kinase
VPNVVSRDQLGKAGVKAIKDYYVSKFGPEGTPVFRAAQAKFVASMAGYSVLCYLLGIKVSMLCSSVQLCLYTWRRIGIMATS